MLSIFKTHPKLVFLIDGLGAVLTAFLLRFLLYNYESTFGMPKTVLFYLILLPVLYAIYSFTCYFLPLDYFKSKLKIIAGLNLVYCVLSLCLMGIYFTELTALGVTYFVVEIIIILVVVWVEINVANNY